MIQEKTMKEELVFLVIRFKKGNEKRFFTKKLTKKIIY